jgi:hypothetical protein
MSWDIVLFNTQQKIGSMEEIDEGRFLPTDFAVVLDQHFNVKIVDDMSRQVSGVDFSFTYYVQAEPSGNTLINLYGENALYAIIDVAKQQGWQIFDTGNGEMIDLDNPEKNGYNDFQKYLQHVRRG